MVLDHFSRESLTCGDGRVRRMSRQPCRKITCVKRITGTCCVDNARNDRRFTVRNHPAGQECHRIGPGLDGDLGNPCSGNAGDGCRGRGVSPDGHLIVKAGQGDIGDRIYIIASGQAEVARGENGLEAVLARLGPGEYFGEMALLNRTTRNATVRCLEPLDVLSIHKREFNTLAANLPAMRESFERVMAQRSSGFSS